MKRRATVLVVLLGVATLSLILLGRSFLRSRELRRNLPRVRSGMSAAEVRSLLGEPKRIAKPCWTDNRQCVYDYIYPMPLRVVSYWVISFNDKNTVIDKEDWHSP